MSNQKHLHDKASAGYSVQNDEIQLRDLIQIFKNQKHIFIIILSAYTIGYITYQHFRPKNYELYQVLTIPSIGLNHPITSSGEFLSENKPDKFTIAITDNLDLPLSSEIEILAERDGTMVKYTIITDDKNSPVGITILNELFFLLKDKYKLILEQSMEKLDLELENKKIVFNEILEKKFSLEEQESLISASLKTIQKRIQLLESLSSELDSLKIKLDTEGFKFSEIDLFQFKYYATQTNSQKEELISNQNIAKSELLALTIEDNSLTKDINYLKKESLVEEKRKVYFKNITQFSAPKLSSEPITQPLKNFMIFLLGPLFGILAIALKETYKKT